MIALIIMGQMLVGIIIDHFGLFGVANRHIDLARSLGVVALLIGGYLIARNLGWFFLRHKQESRL